MIEEITLYVPNVPGQVSRALRALAEAQVNLLAFSLEQAGAYGIVRLVPDDVAKAEVQLQKYALGLSKTEVFAIAMPHKPGALQDVTEALATSGINIEYGYVAMPRNTTEAIILLKINKEDEAREVLAAKGIQDLGELR